MDNIMVKISDLQSELSKALDDVQAKLSKKEDLSNQLEVASEEYAQSVNAAVELRKQLDTEFNKLLPDMGRVRMS
jgi:DNA repair ATPase RecN